MKAKKLRSNNTLEVTFDPSLTFAAAKAGAASNAPQRGRWATEIQALPKLAIDLSARS